MTPEARQLPSAGSVRPRADPGGDPQLLLYAHGQATIGVEDVEAVVGDASELAIEQILLSASGGNGRKAVMELDHGGLGRGPQGLLVLLLRHFQRLHRLRAALDLGPLV